MKTIALFSTKGGVGRTSIAYHLGFMFAELGRRVLLADLDPQANLSTLCLSDERLEEIWTTTPAPTIWGATERLTRGMDDVDRLDPEPVARDIALIPGDLRLLEFEEDLSQQWPRCLVRDPRAFHVTTALSRAVRDVGVRSGAEIAVLDMAPGAGALNRAALLAADHVIVPVAPDPLSVRGLEHAGRLLEVWRDGWKQRRACAPDLDFELPGGNMMPLGYVVARHSTYMGRPVTLHQRWVDRVPAAYRQSFNLPDEPELDIAADPSCLAQLKDYRSLIMMAQEARRPMFLLRPADGAIGGHQAAVREAYEQYRALAATILDRIAAPGSLADR